MLIALSGVTGVGKTYYTGLIHEKFGFELINTIRTRPIRKNEKNIKNGLFLTDEQLDSLKTQGKIIYDFKVFGGRYAYLKEEILSPKNHIFEMHYTMIDDWKKIVPNIKTIYIFPTDIKIPKKQLEQRNLSLDKELERVKEIDEQYNIMKNDKEFLNKFDYIIYNDYSENSTNELLNLIEKILEEEKIGI